MTAHRARLGNRWHFQHGPIDLVIDAEGDARAVDTAHESAWGRFAPILEALVDELPWLKQPVDDTSWLRGPVAQRMLAACRPHATRFVTPMAAVAGAVADELIGCYRRRGIERAWINNGGDIAIHLADRASLRVGLFADLSTLDIRQWDGVIACDAGVVVTAAMAVRGVATSGWRGRSFSLGIADSVTVLASSAATADAAATMIANAVDVDDARIVRRPASVCKDDSDLGDRLVTVAVPALGADAVQRALDRGCAHAEALCDDGAIVGAALVCQGMMRVTDRLADDLRTVAPTWDRIALRRPRPLVFNAPATTAA